MWPIFWGQSMVLDGKKKVWLSRDADEKNRLKFLGIFVQASGTNVRQLLDPDWESRSTKINVTTRTLPKGCICLVRER